MIIVRPLAYPTPIQIYFALVNKKISRPKSPPLAHPARKRKFDLLETEISIVVASREIHERPHEALKR
jgi:hypothetical protein